MRDRSLLRVEVTGDLSDSGAFQWNWRRNWARNNQSRLKACRRWIKAKRKWINSYRKEPRRNAKTASGYIDASKIQLVIRTDLRTMTDRFWLCQSSYPFYWTRCKRMSTVKSVKHATFHRCSLRITVPHLLTVRSCLSMLKAHKISPSNLHESIWPSIEQITACSDHSLPEHGRLTFHHQWCFICTIDTSR